jgi:hypothetical protein
MEEVQDKDINPPEDEGKEAAKEPDEAPAGDGEVSRVPNAAGADAKAEDLPKGDAITKGGAYDDLFTYLEEINGQDAYDSKAAALGKLTRAKYLKVPIGFKFPEVSIQDVGTAKAFSAIPKDVQAQIYALNKDAFDGEASKVKGALLRMFLCAAGWGITGQTYEVVEVTPAKDAAQVMATDLSKIKEVAIEAKRLAILLPIISEHVFRTMGHHYLSGQATEFEAKYKRAFSACVEPTLSMYLSAEDLYHTAGHWVSLSRALAVVKDPIQSVRLPNALVIRSNAPPAGTAIITTTIAVLSALEGTGLKKSYIEAAGIDEDSLTKMAVMVTQNPGAYHTIPSAYGEPSLSEQAQKALMHAKSIAIQMAPIMQGFVDSLPRGCDLAAARALSKHADANPAMRMRAKRFFQETSRTKAGTISELLNMARRANILSANDIIGDEDLGD